MAIDKPDDEMALDPAVVKALEQRFARTRRAAGDEPEGLEEVALYVDGALPDERRRAVEARLAAEPELRAAVDALSEAGEPRATPEASNALVIPFGRAKRVGQAGIGGVRPLPVPEPKKNPMRGAIIGIGAALALAAILFLVVQPPMTSGGTHGAGLGAKPDGVAIGFEAGHAVLEVEARQVGELTVLVATPSGTRAVGLCDAKACLVTYDHLPLRLGKNTARAVIGSDNGACAYVLALTADGAAGAGPSSERSAAYVDPHATAKALGTVVSEGCVLESLERLRTVSGARHVAFMKVP